MSQDAFSSHDVVIINPLFDTQMAATCDDSVLVKRNVPDSKSIEMSALSPSAAVGNKEQPNSVSENITSFSKTSEFRFANLPFGWIALGTIALTILVLFIASVTLAYQQASGSAMTAHSYDDISFKTSAENFQWNLFPIEVPTFLTPLQEQQLVNTQPPNYYIPNFCSNSNCTFSNGQAASLSTKAMSDNYIRLELAWANLVPAVTGGSVSLIWHVSLPPIMLNQNQLYPSSIFNVQFRIDNFLITIPTSSVTFDGKLDFRLSEGTINLFPIDVYSKTFQIYCTITDTINALPAGGYLYPVINFLLKIDKSDLGPFTHSDTFLPFQWNPDGTFVPPRLTSSFSRPTIGRIFPMFIIVAFWLIPIFEVIFFAPNFMGAKCTNPAPVSVAIGVLFALPGIRNTIGNGVPIGAVMDFGSFFWAELIAVLCFMFISYRYCVDNRPSPPK
jgi:hypothetical protein